MPDKGSKRLSDERALARWNNEGGAPRSGDLSARTRPRRPLMRSRKEVREKMEELGYRVPDPQPSARLRRGHKS
jgi:hypothetical protein